MDPIRPLAESLRSLSRWLEASDCDWMLIGGVAVALTARPRATVDADVTVLLDEDRIPEFIKSGEQYGIVARIADAVSFALENRVLLMRHRESSVDIDVALGLLPFEVDALERAVLVLVEDFNVRLIAPEDLLIMKAIAGREKDWLDVANILSSRKGLDLLRVVSGVREICDLMEDSGPLCRLQALISESQEV